MRRGLAALEKEMAGYAASGFVIVKMKVGLLSVEADAERLAVARRAVGPQVKLLVDANHAHSAATAIRIGRELERHGVLWFEEPVVPEDRSGYRKVRDALSVPVAGGECEYTRYGFRDLFIGQCVDIAQPDLCVCGGFSEWLKIQALAASFGVATIPHVWGSGIALGAALHALAAIPPSPHTANPIVLQNEPVVEFDRTRNPLRDDLLHDKFVLNDGALLVPQRPGLGIRIDESILAKYGAQR
jgi:D-galactarolactone cycloisomerase